MSVLLRPEQLSDLPILTGGDSTFDEWGPKAPRTEVRPCNLKGAGGLTIVDENGDVAGDVTWHWNHWGPNPESRCPMIGIWLRPRARAHGIGRLAQRQIVELFFAHTGVNRVEAHTDIENTAEQRALEAAGFQRDGLLRGAQWRHGAYRDGYLYSILRADIAEEATGSGGASA